MRALRSIQGVVPRARIEAKYKGVGFQEGLADDCAESRGGGRYDADAVLEIERIGAFDD